MEREEVEARLASLDEELARMRLKASVYKRFVESLEEEHEKLSGWL
jgi:hypothetical protein